MNSLYFTLHSFIRYLQKRKRRTCSLFFFFSFPFFFTGMSAAIVGFEAQVLGPRSLRPILSRSNSSPSLLPFPKPRHISKTSSSSLLHHNRHRLPPLEFSLTGRRPSRLGTSLQTQDLVLDEEEVTDGGGSRGFDWGQQDEASDEEGQRKGVESGEGGGRGGFSVPPEGARLFVGNLPFDVGSEELAGIFQQAGEVEIAEVIYNRETDRSRGFGFVTMETIEEAEKAIDVFNNYDLNGRLLAVNKASRRGSQPIRAAGVSNRRLFVGNLPWEVDDARLEQVFGEYGRVVESRVVYERETGRSRGFGFVKMSTNEEIDRAIASLDGQNLDGRPIRVSVAEERLRRSF